jgi:hypothetical protein
MRSATSPGGDVWNKAGGGRTGHLAILVDDDKRVKVACARPPRDAAHLEATRGERKRRTRQLSEPTQDDAAARAALAVQAHALATRPLKELAAGEDAAELLGKRIRLLADLCTRRDEDLGVLCRPARLRARGRNGIDPSLLRGSTLVSLGLVVIARGLAGRGRRCRERGQVRRAVLARVVLRPRDIGLQSALTAAATAAAKSEARGGGWSVRTP